jgi:hypothetical protein
LGPSSNNDGEAGSVRHIVNGLPDPFASLQSAPVLAVPLPSIPWAVTLRLCTLPFGLPSTGRTQTKMEADMNNDYQIITKNWRGIEIEIRWQNSYVEFEDGRHLGHLEIESMKPARAALPVTETGYRSHFIDAKSVINAGGPAAYVEAWFEDAGAQKCWHKCQARQAASNQLSLF